MAKPDTLDEPSAGGARVLVVMGVSGSGKTTLGAALAKRLGWDFVDADDLHPRSNVTKMHSGQPLTDSDRAPWLAKVREWIAGHFDRDRSAIVACSALKRRYRDVLGAGRPGVTFIALEADRSLLAKRLGDRTSHFMPSTLLDSQLADYERPAPDEGAIFVPAGLPVERQVDIVIRASGSWM